MPPGAARRTSTTSARPARHAAYSGVSSSYKSSSSSSSLTLQQFAWGTGCCKANFGTMAPFAWRTVVFGPSSCSVPSLQTTNSMGRLTGIVLRENGDASHQRDISKKFLLGKREKKHTERRGNYHGGETCAMNYGQIIASDRERKCDLLVQKFHPSVLRVTPLN